LVKGPGRLAKLYRKLGKAGDAKSAEAELAKLLAKADPDFPGLPRVKQQ
jgi:hypothetical protein